MNIVPEPRRTPSKRLLLCLRGAHDICAAVGENPKHILRLVREQGLPAWRRGGKGAWRALPDDLKCWLAAQRDRNLEPGACESIGVQARPLPSLASR